jgi:hypothetical protein
MGKDKHENEDLIKYGWPEDLWFHVDDLSSAHVYLRMKPGQTWDDLPEQAIEDCCQLVKDNSIKGCKKASVRIVFTPWSNLKKTADMAVGQIGYHNRSMCRFKTIDKNRDIVKRLNKTKTEDHPDLAAQRRERDAKETQKRRAKRKEDAAAAKEAEKARMEEARIRSYDGFFDDGAGGGGEGSDDDADWMEGGDATYDASAAEAWEDDFM